MTFATSTRGHGPVSLAEALADGLAPDGGLYLPVSTRRLAGPPSTPTSTFRRTAAAMARTLLDGEVEPELLVSVVDRALSFPVPLAPLEEGLWLLELFHGPTLAFKDVGARFLARSLAALAPRSERTVLVATSGDTGGAVADAFHGVEGTRVVALFPQGAISEGQRRQMSTLGGNVLAVAVEGTFDDCQRLTKEAFAEPELRHHRLTSANSINLGRLLPQAFYYAHGAVQRGWDAEPPTWIVPSGNLGNLVAGVLAERCGVPARRFLAAHNRNRTFPDWLETGDHAPRPSVATPSTAMDVGDPSNLERLRALFDDDREALLRKVGAVSVDDRRTMDTLTRARGERGIILDPHTAVGLAAWEDAGRPRPAVILATAHPAKFPEVVRRATGHPPPIPRRLARRLEAEERVARIPAELGALARLLDGGVG